MKELLKNWVGLIIFFIVAWWLVSLFQQQKLLMDESEIPAFSLTTLDGQVVTNEDMKGQYVLMYFFAPWCHICHFSIENVEAVRRNMKDDVAVYAVALDFESKREVENFVSEHELTMPILLGTHDVAERFMIQGYPTYYVVDENGKVQSKDMGFSTELGMTIRLMF